jgi:uncharacterized protein (TIGR03118 family)
MRTKTACFTALLLLPLLAHGQASNSYSQTNLVSDGTVKAQQTDPNLLNPWGIAIGQQTPFWINAAGSGLSAVYDSGGNKQFVVKIPSAGTGTKNGTPTGIAFNMSTTDFVIPGGSAALFLFDTLDGTISAWNPSTTNAVVVADNSATGAVYTGLAIDNNGTANYILAANLASAKIDVFDAKFKPAALAGNFVDPGIPQGFAPFNVHVLNSKVYVTYAMQTAGGGPPTSGAALGYVSVFDANGNLQAHAISGGNLNAPWGIALAPAGFGQLGGDLLVGNFGDGRITAFDPTTFAVKGQLQDSTGTPISNDRLWEILFGQNGTGDPNTLYFSAGVNDEKGGLFGAITAAAAAATGDFQVAASVPALTLAAGASGTVQIQVAPANGFSAPVTFSASGVPAGLTFQFSPASVTPTAGAATTTTLTISPAAVTPAPGGYMASAGGPSHFGSVIAVAAVLPLGLAALLPVMLRRRRIRNCFLTCGGTLTLLAISLTMAGCGGAKTASMTTPAAAGTSTVTVTATSGTIVHTTTLTLTVQ